MINKQVPPRGHIEREDWAFLIRPGTAPAPTLPDLGDTGRGGCNIPEFSKFWNKKQIKLNELVVLIENSQGIKNF
jgi:hypothetical protein